MNGYIKKISLILVMTLVMGLLLAAFYGCTQPETDVEESESSESSETSSCENEQDSSEDVKESENGEKTEVTEEIKEPAEEETEDKRFEKDYAPVRYFGPEEIAKIAKDYEWGANKSNMLGAYVSEDKSYVTLIPFDGEQEACFYLFQSFQKVGPIMSVKYRTEIPGFYMEFFTNSYDLTAQASSNFNIYGLKSNGEWDVRFVDLYEKIPTVFNGTSLNHMRFDFANGNPIPPETELDIEYIAFFNTIEDAQKFEYGEDYVAPEEGGGTNENSPLYFGAIDVFNSATGNEAKNLESATLADDFSYVTLTTAKGGSNDAYINLLKSTKAAAPYIAIKYRTTSEGFWIETFMDSVNSSAKGGSSFTFTPDSDGEWHIYVLNVKDRLGETIFNGEKINYIRFDFANCNSTLGEWSIDIEYIAFFNTEEEAYGGSIPDGGDVEGDVAYFDGPAIKDAAEVSPAKNKNLASAILSENKSFVTLLAKKDGANDAYINLLASPAKADKYFAIKYRTEHEKYWVEFFMDSVNSGATGGSNFTFYPTADGEWHIFVINIQEKLGDSLFNGNSVNYIRFDFANCNDKLGDWSIDVAGLGFFESEDAAIEALGNVNADGDQKPEDGGNTEVEDTNPDPVFVIDPQYMADKINTKATNIENCTVSEDGSYISINPTDGIEEAYAYMFTTTTEAGRYMVIKYRTTSPTFYMQVYLNTPDHSAGKGSISIDGINNDGSWQYAIFDLSAELGASRFDGSNLGHMRIDFINMKDGNKTTSSTGIDVAYVAFFTNLAAAENYAGK